MIALFILILVQSAVGDDISENQKRSGRIIVLPYPESYHPYHRPPPEPYAYPGPSPPVKIPQRMQEPYFINSAAMFYSDFSSQPKWCKNMWEREECGMKCWMLRKICRNIASQQYSNNQIRDDDSESSPSIPYPFYKPFPHPYHPFHMKPAVTYSKTNLPQTYFANPSWSFIQPRRPYKNPEIGLNPSFTYVDGNEKPSTTTEETTTSTSTTTEVPATTVKTKLSHPKGTYAVKVANSYPQDSEVTTLSPAMFEYDQYGNRGYYGDRIYMSTVLPVSGRRDAQADIHDVALFDDFDELFDS